MGEGRGDFHVALIFSSLLQEEEASLLMYSIPDWEKQVAFNPVEAQRNSRKYCCWTTLNLESAESSLEASMSAESLWDNPLAHFDIHSLPFGNPAHFCAGQLHNNVGAWDYLLDSLDTHSEGASLVRQWIHQGVDIGQYFRPFKGNFKGKAYNSAIPDTFLGETQALVKLSARSLLQLWSNASWMAQYSFWGQ